MLASRVAFGRLYFGKVFHYGTFCMLDRLRQGLSSWMMMMCVWFVAYPQAELTRSWAVVYHIFGHSFFVVPRSLEHGLVNL